MSTPRWQLRYAPHLGVRSLDTPLFKETLQTLDPIAHIRHAAELGFAGIADNLAKVRPRDEQERMGAELARLGLAMSAFSSNPSFDNVSAWGSRDADVLAGLEQEMLASIETARRLGGRTIVVTGKRDLRVPIGFELANMVANLKELVHIAAKADVVLCLEHTSESRVPGRLLHHLADAYRVVQAVASPHVQLVFDTFHTQAMDGDLINNFRRVRDCVAIVQIADCPGRFEPGTGEINFVNFLRVLRQEKFLGLVELEYFISKPGAGGEQHALQTLREIDAMV